MDIYLYLPKQDILAPEICYKYAINLTYVMQHMCVKGYNILGSGEGAANKM